MAHALETPQFYTGWYISMEIFCSVSPSLSRDCTMTVHMDFVLCAAVEKCAHIITVQLSVTTLTFGSNGAFHSSPYRMR